MRIKPDTVRDAHHDLLWIVGLAVLWWIPAAGQIEKYFGPLSAIAALPAVAVALALGKQFADRYGDDPRVERLARIGIWLTVGLLAVAFVVVYPIAQSGALGPGSDADEALDRAIAAILRGDYPYYERTYLDNPISPMPGALLLALPFHILLGGAAFQNPFSLAIFAWFLTRCLGRAVDAALFLGAFVVFHPATMQEYLTGTDYSINAMYVAVAIYAVAVSWPAAGDRRPLPWLAAVLLAVAVSSRPTLVVVLPVVAAYVLQNTTPRRTAGFIAVLAVALAVLNLPFLLYDVSGFSPLHITSKAEELPNSKYYLPVAALLCASSAILVRLDVPRMLLITGAALGIMILPVYVAHAIPNGIDTFGGHMMQVTLLAGLPLFRGYMRRSRRPEHEAAYGARTPA